MDVTTIMNQANHTEHTGQKTEADNAHFSVASFDVSSLGQLEDLFSIGSHEQPTLSSAASVPHSHFTPSNAVHMEIQENAKLPTFNLSVDRRNRVTPEHQTLSWRRIPRMIWMKC